jgi:hypothetical protein
MFADVTEEEQMAWQSELRKDWVMLNFNGLPINEIEHDYADVKVDARSLVQVMGQVAQATQHNTHLLYAMQSEVRDVREEVRGVKETNRILVEDNKRLMNLLQSSGCSSTSTATSLEIDYIAPPRKRRKSVAMSWEAFRTELHRTQDVEMKFIHYHLNQGEASYTLWKDIRGPWPN